MTMERGDGARPFAENKDAVSLLLVGETNVQNRDDPASAFVNVMPMLRAADLVFGQLEGPMCPPSQDPAIPDIPHKEGWRHSDPRMAQGLKEANYAAVSCASNVCYPPSAAVRSAATLDEAGIPHCGIGRTLAEARRPAIVERRGVRFGFLGYTSVFWPVGHAAGEGRPGCATIAATTAYQQSVRALEMPGAPPIVTTRADPDELSAMVEDVRGLRDKVDIVVVSCHWGVSGSDQPVDYQREIGRAAIEAGADIVLGHHPHVPQGIAIHRGRPIIFSTGNFVFDWTKMHGRHKVGIVFNAVIRNRQLAGLSCLPVGRDETNTVGLLDPREGAGRALMEKMRAMCAAEGTRLDEVGCEFVVRGVDAEVATRAA